MSPIVSRVWNLAFAALLAVAGVSVCHAQDPPAASGENLVSVRLLFGLKRLTPTRWDGEIRVSTGRVLKITGVHFEGRDAVQGANRWLLTTRVTRYGDSTTPRGYDPVHTRPYAMIPNGVVATLDAPPDATVNVETEAGRFSFRLEQLRLGRPVQFLDGEASAERLPPTRGLTSQAGY
ncbi:MAG: hypothetical protein GY953_01615, partial [bacterium]|nr:hypothetical protein [bacterium]